MSKSFDDFKFDISEDELSNIFDIKIDESPFSQNGGKIRFDISEIVGKLTSSNLLLMKEMLRQYHEFMSITDDL